MAPLGRHLIPTSVPRRSYEQSWMHVMGIARQSTAADVWVLGGSRHHHSHLIGKFTVHQGWKGLCTRERRLESSHFAPVGQIPVRRRKLSRTSGARRCSPLSQRRHPIRSCCSRAISPLRSAGDRFVYKTVFVSLMTATRQGRTLDIVGMADDDEAVRELVAFFDTVTFASEVPSATASSASDLVGPWWKDGGADARSGLTACRAQ